MLVLNVSKIRLPAKNLLLKASLKTIIILLQGGILVAETKHSRGRQDHELVGLRLSDLVHG